MDGQYSTPFRIFTIAVTQRRNMHSQEWDLSYFVCVRIPLTLYALRMFPSALYKRTKFRLQFNDTAIKTSPACRRRPCSQSHSRPTTFTMRSLGGAPAERRLDASRRESAGYLPAHAFSRSRNGFALIRRT